MSANRNTLLELRQEIDKQDLALLEALARRFSLVSTIAELKKEQGSPLRDPERERELLEDRIARGEATGIDASLVVRLFQMVISHSVRLQRRLILGRAGQSRPDVGLPLGASLIREGGFAVIAGPCAIESEEQIQACAQLVKRSGGSALCGSTFQPGLRLLAQAGRDHDLLTIAEVVQPSDVERVAAEVDILQIGAGNMQNFALLREVGGVNRPVLLKRGLAATIDEWLDAAEYILAAGNQQVIFCERGIRPFDTGFTLDLAAVPILRERTHLPVIVDPSHPAGDWRYVTPLALAAKAVGSHGIMVAIQPNRSEASAERSPALSFKQFAKLMDLLQSNRLEVEFGNTDSLSETGAVELSVLG